MRTTKDTKKVITMDAQTVDNLNKQFKVLERKGADALKTDIARAKALYTIKSAELFKCEKADGSFKEWYNTVHDGTLYGITYKSACILINVYANVWSDADLCDLPMSIACRLASVCKSEDKAKKVKALKAKGKITPSMTQRAMNDLLKSEGLMTAKVNTDSAPAPRTSDGDNDALMTALSLVNAYMTENCKNDNILKQWNVILDAHK